MNRETLEKIRSHMQHMMRDAAHDQLHVYRVLYQALRIAGGTSGGRLGYSHCRMSFARHRQAQFTDPRLCHAVEGGTLYTVDEQMQLQDGDDPAYLDSFIREYHYKLIHLYDRFYTPEAQAIADARKNALVSYYEALKDEIDISGLNALLRASENAGGQ